MGTIGFSQIRDVVKVAYKMRHLMHLSKDVFYTMIWVYIPEPPNELAPKYDFISITYKNNITSISIYGVYSMWFRLGNEIYMGTYYSKNIVQYICCICEAYAFTV